MNVEQILEYLENKVAPVKLSDDFCSKYKAYDNSGIILNCGGEVKGALFTLDLTEKAAAEAERLGYNLIVTHHPAIYGGILRLDLTCDPQARAIARCLKSGISVISMHLNFDAAPRGIDYYLMLGLGGVDAEISADVTGGGYGRVYSVEASSLSEYAEKIRREFNTSRTLVYGDLNKKVENVASFCGAGCDEHNIAFAKSRKADVFVSADMKHHEILALTGAGIAVIVLTHYASENYGFNKIYLEIKDGLSVKNAYFTDADLL